VPVLGIGNLRLLVEVTLNLGSSSVNTDTQRLPMTNLMKPLAVLVAVLGSTSTAAAQEYVCNVKYEWSEEATKLLILEGQLAFIWADGKVEVFKCADNRCMGIGTGGDNDWILATTVVYGTEGTPISLEEFGWYDIGDGLETSPAFDVVPITCTAI